MGCLQETCHHADFEKVIQHCEEKNIKLTALRRSLLKVICDSKNPLTAYAILDILRDKENISIQAMSVYRVLNFLLGNALIHKIESLNAFVICHHVKDCEHLSQWLICEQCGEVTECDLPLFQQFLEGVSSATGFAVMSPVVELTGLCARCQRA